MKVKSKTIALSVLLIMSAGVEARAQQEPSVSPQRGSQAPGLRVDLQANAGVSGSLDTTVSHNPPSPVSQDGSSVAGNGRFVLSGADSSASGYLAGSVGGAQGRVTGDFGGAAGIAMGRNDRAALLVGTPRFIHVTNNTFCIDPMILGARIRHSAGYVDLNPSLPMVIDRNSNFFGAGAGISVSGEVSLPALTLYGDVQVAGIFAGDGHRQETVRVTSTPSPTVQIREFTQTQPDLRQSGAGIYCQATVGARIPVTSNLAVVAEASGTVNRTPATATNYDGSQHQTVVGSVDGQAIVGIAVTLGDSRHQGLTHSQREEDHEHDWRGGQGAQ